MRTHGYCRGDNRSKSYRAWANMLSRCNNKNHQSYAYYGGRGIVVCGRWSMYVNFLADMGEPKDGESLDRIDNNGPYGPFNCRWTSAKTQQRNTRRSRMIMHQGKTQSLSAWAEETGIEWMTISCRLKRGWTPEKALTTPSLKPVMKFALNRNKAAYAPK